MQASKKRKMTDPGVSKTSKMHIGQKPEQDFAQAKKIATDESVSCATSRSLEAMKTAQSEVERLVKIRADHKLSNSRANSVAKELKELIKVLSLYNY